jgi:hypothetical protein
VNSCFRPNWDHVLVPRLEWGQIGQGEAWFWCFLGALQWLVGPGPAWVWLVCRFSLGCCWERNRVWSLHLAAVVVHLAHGRCASQVSTT